VVLDAYGVAARSPATRSDQCSRPPTSGRSQLQESTASTTASSYAPTSIPSTTPGYLAVDHPPSSPGQPGATQRVRQRRRVLPPKRARPSPAPRRLDRPNREFLERHLDEKFLRPAPWQAPLLLACAQGLVCSSGAEAAPVGGWL
jgi:hypothetical protein